MSRFPLNLTLFTSRERTRCNGINFKLLFVWKDRYTGVDSIVKIYASGLLNASNETVLSNLVYSSKATCLRHPYYSIKEHLETFLIFPLLQCDLHHPTTANSYSIYYEVRKRNIEFYNEKLIIYRVFHDSPSGTRTIKFNDIPNITHVTKEQC